MTQSIFYVGAGDQNLGPVQVLMLEPGYVWRVCVGMGVYGCGYGCVCVNVYGGYTTGSCTDQEWDLNFAGSSMNSDSGSQWASHY